MNNFSFSIDDAGNEIKVAQDVTGFFKTNGAEIVDEFGTSVQLVGANWFGAEGVNGIPNGLWVRNYKDMMLQMVDAGMNVIRLPISPEVLDPEPVTTGLYNQINSDLNGLSRIEIMDKIIDFAGQIGVRVILDMHRIDAGAGKQESGLWYSEDYTIENLADDWQEIAGRYAGNPTVIGADVFNEPSGPAHWGEEDNLPENDWAAAAETLGNAILEANPDLLILVQGVHIVDDQWYWVGGNLKGAATRPIELEVEDRLVYSPHDYPFSVQNVPWLKDATPDEMLELFRSHWGYLAEEGIAPILLGETGGRLNHPADPVYFETLFAYLEGLAGGSSVTWWGWNPNSEDTGGLLSDSWQTVDQDKLEYLHSTDPVFYPATEAARDFLEGSHEVINVSFDATRGHDRAFLVDIDAVDANGSVVWSQDGILQIRANHRDGTVDVYMPVDLRASAETLNVSLSFLNGAPMASFVQPLSDLPGIEPPPQDPLVLSNDGVNAHVIGVIDDGLAAGLTAEVMARETDLSVTTGITLDLSLNGLDASLTLEGSIYDGAVDAFLFWSQSDGAVGLANLSGEGVDNSDALDVKMVIESAWGNYFHSKIHVTNTGDTSMPMLDLMIDGYGFDLDGVFKVESRELGNGGIQISLPDWQRQLQPGEVMVFGVDGRFDDSGLTELGTAAAAVNGGVGSAGLFDRGLLSLSWGSDDAAQTLILQENAQSQMGNILLEVDEIEFWDESFSARLELTLSQDQSADDLQLLLDGVGFDFTGIGSGDQWTALNQADIANVDVDQLDAADDVTLRLRIEGLIDYDTFLF